MTSALATQFHIYLPWVNAHSAKCLKCESSSSRFNQEKALVGAYSVITNLRFKLYLWPEVRARAQAALLLLGARTLD